MRLVHIIYVIFFHLSTSRLNYQAPYTYKYSRDSLPAYNTASTQASNAVVPQATPPPQGPQASSIGLGFFSFKNLSLACLIGYAAGIIIDTIAHYYNTWSCVNSPNDYPPSPTYTFYTTQEEDSINGLIDRIKNKLPIAGKGIIFHSNTPGSGKTTCATFIANKAGAGLLKLLPFETLALPPEILISKYLKKHKKPLIVLVDNFNYDANNLNIFLETWLSKLKQVTESFPGVYLAVATNNYKDLPLWLTSDNQLGHHVVLTAPDSSTIHKTLKSILHPQVSPENIDRLSQQASGLSRAVIIDTVREAATNLYLLDASIHNKRRAHKVSSDLRTFLLPAIIYNPKKFLEILSTLFSKKNNLPTSTQFPPKQQAHPNLPETTRFNLVF